MMAKETSGMTSEKKSLETSEETIRFDNKKIEVPKIDLSAEGDSSKGKKTGRPPKPFREAYKVPEVWVRMLCDLPYNYLSQRFGAHWKLTEEELNTLVSAAKPVADKWIPELFKKYPEEGILLITVAMITASKMVIGKQVKQQQKPEEKKVEEKKDGNIPASPGA